MTMKDCARKCAAASTVLIALIIGSVDRVVALQVPEKNPRFDALVVDDPAVARDVATTPLGSLHAADGARVRWEQFRAVHGPEWSIYLDRRSGAPLLAEGKGIAWPMAKVTTIDSLAPSVREFIGKNRALFLADDAELVLSRDGSGELIDGVWQVVFNREIAGIPVAGERYLFTIGRGKLISFGAPRWSRIDVNPVPDLDAAQAQAIVSSYMKLDAADAADFFEKPRLEFIPLSAPGQHPRDAGGAYAGPFGSGYASALVWRVALRVADGIETWVAQVDAHTGAIRSFKDDNHYARAKGGVFPISGDGICPDGCEQPNYPMPFANIIGSTNQTTTTMGFFNCTPGGSTASTTLAGQYIRVSDSCGLISQSVTCDADLN
jgi:hypothetical protein